MQKIFDGIVRIVSYLSQFFGWLGGLKTSLFITFCFTAECITNPQGAFNFWICAFIDLIADILPSTPPSMQISTIILNFAVSYPFVGLGILMEVFNTLLVILAMFITVKMIKFVRG